MVKALLAYKGRDVDFMDWKLLFCTGSELKCLDFAEFKLPTVARNFVPYIGACVVTSGLAVVKAWVCV